MFVLWKRITTFNCGEIRQSGGKRKLHAVAVKVKGPFVWPLSHSAVLWLQRLNQCLATTHTDTRRPMHNVDDRAQSRLTPFLPALISQLILYHFHSHSPSSCHFTCTHTVTHIWSAVLSVVVNMPLIYLMQCHVIVWPLWSNGGDGCTGLVGANLAEILHVSIALAYFLCFCTSSVSQCFCDVVVIKTRHLCVYMLLFKSKENYQKILLVLCSHLNKKHFISGRFLQKLAYRHLSA